MLSPRALWLLRLLASIEEDDEPAEDDFDYDLVCEGRTVWLGCQKLRWATLEQLIRCCAVSETECGGDVHRYSINGTGRAIARRPALAIEVTRAIYAQTPFKIVDDEIVLISEKSA